MTSSATAHVGHRKFSDWLGPLLVLLMWGFWLVGWLLDVQTFAWFLITMAVYLVASLLFLVWWFTRSSFTWPQRLAVFAWAIAVVVVIHLLTARTIAQPFFLVQVGMPAVLTVWACWVLATTGLPRRIRTVGLFAAMVVVWSPFLLIRETGFHGNLQADVHWRWTPTGEEMYLAERKAEPATPTTTPAAGTLELRPGDWPGFRGPNRDATVRNLRIDLNWSQNSPKVLWKERVGPAWSSMIVVDGCVFTQEQRADREAVVCRDAMTGKEIWSHEDPGRFEESMSGAGPRATPAFAKGRIYAQGALGKLNCLDGATGRLIWSRDVGKDADAAMPMWGFCNSPLVMDERLIVFAGGEGHKGMLAYSLDGGPPLWTADAGKVSYASPQAFGSGADRQILMFANEGLFALDPSTGQTRWRFPIESKVGLPAALQACPIGPDSLVLGNGADFGMERIRIASDGKSASRQWATPRVKPNFSDMVYHDGFIYGFDGTVFCCVDANTSARRWREGRYGAGQVILLEDQGVMIVSSEDGQAILLRCNPDRNEELGRIQAISGKSWNHPAIAGNRLYVRSDSEMACIELNPAAQLTSTRQDRPSFAENRSMPVRGAIAWH